VPGNRRPAGRMHSWFRPGSGPLIRTSDRLGSVARALLAVSLFAAVPIALTAASATYTHVRAVATAQAGERHSVSVTLVEDVPPPPDEAWSNPPNEEATAAWADPAGVEHDVPVSVPAGTRAGSTVSVWIDRDGNRTPPPLAGGAVTAEAVCVGILALGGLCLVALGAYRWVCALLDRSRSRRWAADWVIVEPVWSRRVP
jgi:hypothetical protein